MSSTFNLKSGSYIKTDTNTHTHTHTQRIQMKKRNILCKS